MVVEGRIISLILKISQVTMKDHGPSKGGKGRGRKGQSAAPSTPPGPLHSMGGIERGSVDGEEER